MSVLPPLLRVVAVTITAVMLPASTSAGRKRCEDYSQLAKSGAALSARNRARLVAHVEKLGYDAVTLPSVHPATGNPLPGAQTSSVTIAGESVVVYATRSAVLGAGQSIDTPLFAKNDAGQMFIVAWTPKKTYELTPRACGCVLNGGGAPRRAQLVFQLPDGVGSLETLPLTEPHAEVFRPIGPVCRIPSAPRRP